MRKIIIAIDGYSACGKSSTAKEVASRLNYSYIDTGAMYRAVTHYFLQHHITLTNPREVQKALENIHIDFVFNPRLQRSETFLNGLNVEDKIRSMKVSSQVSEVSALAVVRKAMVEQQRKMGKRKGVVMDGRDIGTVVFPEAELKIFMNADFSVRAERRQKELLERGTLIDLDAVMENLRKRDHLDTSREESPLRKAEDAIEINTTHVTMEEQVEEIIQLATGKILQSEEKREEVHNES